MDSLAKKRHPSKGFAFIDESAFAEEHPGALQHTETPDEIFHRTWLRELVLRVLKRLERACRESGRETRCGAPQGTMTCAVWRG